MQLIHYIGVNLRRTIGSSTFWFCVLAAFSLCFTAVIAKDPQTNDDLMILQVLFRPEMIKQQAEMNAWNIFCSVGGTWFAMFAPILSAFPFVPAILNNRITQSARFIISRIGKRCYQMGNICGTFLSGGIAVTLGYALFGTVVWLLFPSMSEYSEQSVTIVVEMQTYGKPAWYAEAIMEQRFFLPIAVQLGQMFLYSGCTSLLSLVFASFVKNPYVVLCMPFFCTYGWAQINTRFSAIAYADLDNINMNLGRFASLTSPRALLSLIGFSCDIPLVLSIHLGFALLLCIVFYLIMTGRGDCGE